MRRLDMDGFWLRTSRPGVRSDETRNVSRDCPRDAMLRPKPPSTPSCTRLSLAVPPPPPIHCRHTKGDFISPDKHVVLNMGSMFT